MTARKTRRVVVVFASCVVAVAAMRASADPINDARGAIDRQDYAAAVDALRPVLARGAEDDHWAAAADLLVTAAGPADAATAGRL